MESNQDMVRPGYVNSKLTATSSAVMFELLATNTAQNPSRLFWRCAVVAPLIVAASVMISPAASYSADHEPAADLARSLNATTTAHLHLVKTEGSELLEEGPVSGSLVGSMQAELVTGAVYTGSFTTVTREGSIKGHGTATPHGSGRYQSFSGRVVVTGGTGRYAHVRGHAGLYGVFDRRHDSVIVQTTGKLSY